MYERSAIVLERYLNKIFGQENQTSIKASCKIFEDIIEEMQKYQIITEEEEKIISEFDEIARQMQDIQKKQETLCSENITYEEEMNKLFNDFDQTPEVIEKKLLKLEDVLDKNLEEQRNIREEYVEQLKQFTEKQRERNKCSKSKRLTEANHIKVLNETIEKIDKIDLINVKKVKEFMAIDNESINQSLCKIMIENGKNEKVKFDSNVIEKAVNIRLELAKREADCYINTYEKLKKLMTEIESDNLKLDKYKKLSKSVTVKLKFIDAEKEYIINFLDNERMTAINGEKIHKQMMKEAVKNFEQDIEQINNLYNLILKELSGKATKKAYNELYNSTYLKDIEETEKNFNKEVNSIKANVGTIINTNYWRIEGIKNIYEIFNQEVEENFERDLSEFMPQEIDIFNEEDEEEEEDIELMDFENDEIEEDDDTEEWFISNKEVKELEQETEEDYDEEEEEFEDDEYEEYDDEDEEYIDEDEDEELETEEDDDDEDDVEIEDDEDGNEDDYYIRKLKTQYGQLKKSRDAIKTKREVEEQEKNSSLFGRIFKK